MTEKLNNWLKQHRLTRGLTQQDLAQAAQVSRQTIISVEQGRYLPSLPLALRLAAIFDCPVENLFRLDPERPA